MEFYHILFKAHGGMGMLLLLLAVISLLMAVVAATKGTNEGFMKMANTAGLIEIITAGIVTLTGVVAMVMGPWPLTQIWLWIGLVILVLYSVLQKRLTKPARLAAMNGGSAGKWAGLQAIPLLLLIIGFVFMKLKPF